MGPASAEHLIDPTRCSLDGRRACHLDERSESLGIVDRHLGEHLAIDLDLGGLEAGDEL